jgi:hypothetical protein
MNLNTIPLPWYARPTKLVNHFGLAYHIYIKALVVQKTAKFATNSHPFSKFVEYKFMPFGDWLHTKLESTIIAYGLLTKQIIEFFIFSLPQKKKKFSFIFPNY